MAQEKNKLPKHVAIIMDGNGRWAEAKGLVRSDGHESGAKNVKKIILYANTIGLKKLTLWGFSTDNWKRSEYEVSVLMNLFRKFIVQEADELHEREVCVAFVGDRNKLPKQLQRVMGDLEKKTRFNEGLMLEIALNYGGRDEIVRATKSIAAEVLAGHLTLEAVTEDLFASFLDTSDEPDLIIRTSGEQRTSGLMPFQTVSSEWYFEQVPWPEYKPAHFDKALEAYGQRDRRFGGLSKVV